VSTELPERRLTLEPHPVGVTVVVRAGVRIAVVWRYDELAEDDHTGRAAVHTERTPRADVVVDSKYDLIRRVITRFLGAHRLNNGRRVHHVDALPWADVYAALTHDALGLIDVDELLGFDRFREVLAVDCDERVLIGERHHRRVCVGLCHA
jgi:hypothetical protein